MLAVYSEHRKQMMVHYNNHGSFGGTSDTTDKRIANILQI